MICNKRDVVNIFVMVWIWILFGCHGSSDSKSGMENEGVLSLKIRWEENHTHHLKRPAHPFDCKNAGVESLEVILFDSSGTEIFREDSWKCSDHKGTIKGISQDTVNILFLAKDSLGDVLYRGLKKSVVVDHGKSNKVGITASRFVPKLISPMEKSCATHPVLIWNKVKGAAEYHVFVADNKGMKNATTFIEETEQHDLLEAENNQRIFWRVRAVDSQSNRGKMSEVFGFSTSKSLLKDIGPGTADSDPGYFTVIDQKIYFTADGVDNGKRVGQELWVSDGTIYGTKLLKDINPGIRDSYPHNLIGLNGDLIFSAHHKDYGQGELWILKNTKNSPEILKDINPGLDSSYTDFLTKYDQFIYFSAVGSKNGRELWKTDGTPTGTVMVKDIGPDSIDGINPVSFVVFNTTTSMGNKEYLYFSADDGIHGEELWRTDGSETGTIMVKDINPNKGDGIPVCLFAMDNALYFSANDGVHGFELWKSDGTPEGTFLLKDLVSKGEGSPSNFTIINHELFFRSYGDSNTHQLWKSDGTPAGTVMIKEFSYIGKLINYDNKLYFIANDGNSGEELWVSDGTAKGTILFKDIYPGKNGSAPQYLSVIKPNLYFSANDGVHGRELWRSDGTEVGTFMVADIWPNKFSSEPRYFKEVGSNGSFVFSANDGLHGRELWISEGANNEISMLKDLNTIKSDNPPKELTVFRDALFFIAEDDRYGKALWRSDFTEKGTEMVEDINQMQSSNPESLIVLKDRLYFFAHNGKHIGLYKTDANGAQIIPIKSIETHEGYFPVNDIFVANDRLFFIMNETTHGKEVWVSDGTEKGTHSINIAPFNASSYPQSLTVMADKLYFTAKDQSSSKRVLWLTDGTHVNTKKIKVLFSIENLVSLGDRFLYFFDQGGGLWKHKETSPDKPLDAFLVESLRGCWDLNGSGNELFFSCRKGSDVAVWTYDESTQTKTEIIPVSKPGTIQDIGNFTHSANGHYFVVMIDLENERDHYELWFTDGTKNGTYLIKKDLGHLGYIMEEPMIAVGNHLFFKAYDPNHGHELWMTDGTEMGTQMIWDIYPGPEDGNPQEFTLYNNTLYFTAFDKDIGGEIRSFCLDAVLHE